MIILYQYASRSRPQRFFAGLDNILEMQEDSENYIIHCVLDKDDPTIDDSFLKTAQWFSERTNDKIWWNFGTSSGKISAINRALPDIEWDILVNFSDDMRFIFRGFDQVIRSAFEIHGPDIFLHFPDQDAKDALCTLTIEDRTYYERDKKIYFNEFYSLWADNWAMELARKRGRYRYDPARIFNHLCPAYGHLQRDAQFDHQQSYFNTDQATFIRLMAKIHEYA